MKHGRRFVAIGQYPPPLTGLSKITASMVNELALRNRVISVNIAAHCGAKYLSKHASRIYRIVVACNVLVKYRRDPNRTCYIACEGGLGLIYIIIINVFADKLGYTTFLHHHSFAYINTPSMLMRILVATGARINHIFLCDEMRRCFEAVYWPLSRSVLISNAAFVAPHKMRQRERNGSELVLGHLSNLTSEKGLYKFLNLLRRAINSGLNVRGILAGPVGCERDRSAIDDACREFGARFEYCGPLYNKAKENFYEDIDVFVFPTCYVNEAQPTVVFEALAAGCRVISYKRGCIEQQVGNSGVVIAQGKDFCAEAMTWLSHQLNSTEPCRESVRRNYRQMHLKALADARVFFDQNGNYDA